MSRWQTGATRAAALFFAVVLALALRASGALADAPARPASGATGPAIAAILFPGGESVPLVATRMILTGVPPFGAASWTDERGEQVPAGCAPLAARMLLAYYDMRAGYARLVRPDPTKAIVELHDRMHTITFSWGGAKQGFTDPFSFQWGLEAYIAARYPGGATLESTWGRLGQVFQASVALIERRMPHIILFDWRGETPFFPNHYAVVVGFDRTNGRRDLVINPGWGYDFQILDMTDVAVAPAILFWIETWKDPPDGEPACSLGPACAAGMWTPDEGGGYELTPIVREHFNPGRSVAWPASDATELLVSCGSDRIAACYWR